MIVGSWRFWYRSSTEIDFDLNLKIDNLYYRLETINKSIREIRNIIHGRVVSETDKERIEELITVINTATKDISGDLVTTKELVIKEISRLEKLREGL